MLMDQKKNLKLFDKHLNLIIYKNSKKQGSHKPKPHKNKQYYI